MRPLQDHNHGTVTDPQTTMRTLQYHNHETVTDPNNHANVTNNSRFKIAIMEPLKPRKRPWDRCKTANNHVTVTKHHKRPWDSYKPASNNVTVTNHNHGQNNATVASPYVDSHGTDTNKNYLTVTPPQ